MSPTFNATISDTGRIQKFHQGTVPEGLAVQPKGFHLLCGVGLLDHLLQLQEPDLFDGIVMYQFLRDQEIPEAAEIVEPGLHLDPPLLPHHSVVVPQVHPGDILDPFSQEVQHVIGLPGVVPQGAVLPVHRLF